MIVVDHTRYSKTVPLQKETKSLEASSVIELLTFRKLLKSFIPNVQLVSLKKYNFKLKQKTFSKTSTMYPVKM